MSTDQSVADQRRLRHLRPAARPAPPCWRPAPAPARPGRSARWSTRYVAEGRATLDEMLVVTFGRAASQELRERVRAQLVEAERALADPGVRAATPSDLVDAAAATRRPRSAAERRQRLREALGAFDAATIATTHQFCQLVLRSLGVAGDTDAGATLVEDLDDLLGEVVDDLYLRRVRRRSTTDPPFDHGDGAARWRRAAASDPQARLEPTDADPEHRRRAAGGVRPRGPRGAGPPQAPARRAQLRRPAVPARRTRSTDADAPARQRMRQRWQVVLVDEFQDTDPVQWQVLDRAFTGHATMVLIGDPKQAIYAFRGGDVDDLPPGRGAPPPTRRRSAPTAAATPTLLDCAAGAAARRGARRRADRRARRGRRTTRAAGWRARGAPFRLRVVRKDELGGAGRDLSVAARSGRTSYADVARDIKRAAHLRRPRSTGEPLQPRDVAVLAYQNGDLQQVQRGARRGRRAGRGRRQRQRVRHPGRDRVAAAARGAGAAAPLAPGCAAPR